MSRAVPSPPAKRIRSTPSSRNIPAAAAVSSDVVCTWTPPAILPVPSPSAHSAFLSTSDTPLLTPALILYLSPAASQIFAPISPGQVQISIRSSTSFNKRTAANAFCPLSRTAPSESALRQISSPSDPLSPTFPPIPATGFTINPILFMTSASSSSPKGVP